MNIASLFGAIGGIAGKFLGSLTYIPTIIALVETITQIIGKSKINGEGKHALAIALIRQAILSGEGFTGKEIIDEDMFAQGLDEIVHGTVKALNAAGHDWGNILLK